MRADGKRIRHADPMYTVAAYIMNKRYDAMNMVTLDIPMEPMQDYIHAVNRGGEHVISHLGLILAAYVRTVAEFPSLNRFIVNKKIYARNELPIGMVVLRENKMDNGTMSKIYLDVHDDVFTVQKKINDYVEENRAAQTNNPTDKMIRFLLGVPGLVNLGVKLFKFMDRYGLLPKAVIRSSPFHTSLVITNLASIRTNHIYHHIYEFGTTSIAMSLGNTREVARRVKGEIVFEKCLPIGMVMDERICSGSYYALAFRKFKSYLKDPTPLEKPPEVVCSDI